MRFTPGLLSVAAVLVGLCRAGPALALEATVDPRAGEDAAGAGTPERPYRTLLFAFQAHVTEAELILHLRPGRYSGADAREPARVLGEAFPLVPPAPLRRLHLIGPSREEGAAVLETAEPVLTFFDCLSAPRSVTALEEIRIERVHFEGGRGGIALWSLPQGATSLQLLECEFSGQAGAAVAAFASNLSRLDVTVEGCYFQDAGRGVLMGATPGGRVDAVVAGCTFAAFPSFGPQGYLGVAIDTHADGGSEIEADYNRNVIVDCPSAFLFSSQGSGAPARLHCRVRNNLICSSPTEPGGEEASGPRTRNAFYFSLQSHHVIDLRLLHNTVHGVAEHVIYQDNLAEEPLVPVTVANNLFWGGPETTPAGGVRFSGHEVFPPPGMEVFSNTLPRSWIGASELGENWSFAPEFVAPQAFAPESFNASATFALAGGSPAIDRGDLGVGVAAGDEDLGGHCRRSTRAVPLPREPYPPDLGALEHEGTCERGGRFVRGDCDLSGRLQLTDAVYLLGYLFAGSWTITCPDACDANDSGTLELSDAVFVLRFLFMGSDSPPPFPFPSLGRDPTFDTLGECRGPT